MEVEWHHPDPGRRRVAGQHMEQRGFSRAVRADNLPPKPHGPESIKKLLFFRSRCEVKRYRAWSRVPRREWVA